MSELEEKLGAMLRDPQLMQQLQAMAQSMGNSRQPSPAPSIDPRMLQSLSGITGQVDSDQQALLNALCPYLSQQRIRKLEKAMQAAQLAGAASAFLNSGGLNLFLGR